MFYLQNTRRACSNSTLPLLAPPCLVLRQKPKSFPVTRVVPCCSQSAAAASPAVTPRSSPNTGAQHKGSPPEGQPAELILNVGASVWSIDSLVRRPAVVATADVAGDGGDGCNASADDGGKHGKGRGEKRGRGQQHANGGVGGGGGGGHVMGGAGDDMFLAVGTGPLRQTDDCIDEV